MTIYKLGKGKSAIPVLELSKYESRGPGNWYKILHCPTRVLVANSFCLAIGRDLCSLLIEQLGPKLLTESRAELRSSISLELELLLVYLMGRTDKHGPEWDHWVNSPEYLHATKCGWRMVSVQQEREDPRELLEEHSSLGWMATTGGTGITSDEFKELVSCRHW